MLSPLALIFALLLLVQGDTGQLSGRDFSVVRFIPIGERMRGELRTEFFNLFNWTNFANPNSNIAVPATFGRITATSSGPRVIQFAFKVGF